MLFNAFASFALLSGLVSAASFTNVSGAMDSTDQQPIRQNGPDPFMVWDETTSSYYLLTTTNSDLEITASKTIAGFANGDRR